MCDWGYYHQIGAFRDNLSPWYHSQYPMYGDAYCNYASGGDWNRESSRAHAGRANMHVNPARKAPHCLTNVTPLDTTQESNASNKGFSRPTTPQQQYPMDSAGWPRICLSAPRTPPAIPPPHVQNASAHAYLETKSNTLNASGLDKPVQAVLSPPTPMVHAPGRESNNDVSKVNQLAPSPDATKPKTTMMLRNIPNKYTQKMLLNYLESNGFRGTFDFFYLPIDFRNRCNVGYAFINFTAVCHAERFLKMLHHAKLPAYNSNKVCEVTHAFVQGLEQNIEHYRNSPVNGVPVAAYRPLIFKGGVEIGFPKPDAPLPPIQLRPAKV